MYVFASPATIGTSCEFSRETPWSKTLWVYDLRTNKHFMLKQNTLQREDLDDFVTCYMPRERHKREATWSEKNPGGRCWQSPLAQCPRVL